MYNFTTRTLFLFPSFSLDQEEQEKLDRFLLFLEESGVSKILNSVNTKCSANGGRPEYNPCHLLATILYGFAFGSGTLRDIESACHFDLRYIISWIKSALPSRPSLTSSISTLFPIRIRSSLLLSIISSKRLESIMMWFSLMVRKLRQMRININSFGSPLRFIFASAIRSEPF